MAWDTIFSNLAAGNQPLALFDAMFAQIASLSAIPCQAAGATAITLTGLPNAPTLAAYQRYVMFRFRAAGISTGPVTIQYQTLSFVNAYKADGVTPVSNGDLQTGLEYLLIYDSTLNGGAGGMFVESAGLPTAVSSAIVMQGEAGGRLTLQSNTPFMTTNQLAKTTLFYTPDKHQFMPLNINGTMQMVNFGGELSQATTDATKSPAAVAPNSVYFIFGWNDAGIIRATRGPAWTNDTTPGASNALVRTQGVLTNAVAITNGPGVGAGTLLGSVRSNAASAIDWQYGALGVGGVAGIFAVDNVFNRRDLVTFVQESTDSWTYNSGAGRAPNNSATMRVSFLQTLGAEAISGVYRCNASNPGDGTQAAITIGYDGVAGSASGASPGQVGSAVTNVTLLTSHWVRNADQGYHFMSAVEYVANVVTQSTYYGDNALPSMFQNGLYFRGRF